MSITSLMADTRYRGSILWMLLTCRPDLLPADLPKRYDAPGGSFQLEQRIQELTALAGR